MNFMIASQNKKFYDYPSHRHAFWEMLINIEGSGTAIIDGQSYDFYPGTIFCIRPGIPHSKYAENGFIDGSILLMDFCMDSDPGNVFVFQDDDRNSFYSLFRLALDYPVDPATDVYAERFLRSVLDAMQNLLCHWKNANCKNPEVLRVQKILSDHVGDIHFDLNLLLESTSYSPNHFRRLFKEQCGCSPLQYYNLLKIQKAKELLLQHKSIMTIQEIARQCGFEDPYYFSRLFKKIAGCSPMQYYKQSRQTLAETIAGDKADREPDPAESIRYFEL